MFDCPLAIVILHPGNCIDVRLSAIIAPRDKLSIRILTPTLAIVGILDTSGAHARALAGVAPEERPAVFVRLHVGAGGSLAGVGGAGAVGGAGGR